MKIISSIVKISIALLYILSLSLSYKCNRRSSSRIRGSSSRSSSNNDNNYLQTSRSSLMNIISNRISISSSIISVLLTTTLGQHVAYADNDIDIKEQISFVDKLQRTRELNTDEVDVVFDNDSLGIVLQEVQYKGFPVVTIKDIKDIKLNEKYPLLRTGAIITIVGGEFVDGISMKKISELVKSSARPLQVRFRDPSLFFQQLDSTVGKPLKQITSTYLPANTRDAGSPEQIIVVQRLSLPPPEERIRPAEYLDVLEIQYVAQVQGSEDVVDSSAERSAPGTSAKSIYYILGQQNGPPGKFPTGWDLSLRGMVKGETRRITLPYTLAYDRKGVKERKIPPFATMIYTVKLLSLT